MLLNLRKPLSIQGDAKLYYRYMDDIIRSIKRHEIDSILRAINELHPMLQFTIEREIDGRLAFLDMLIIRIESETFIDLVQQTYRHWSSHELPRSVTKEVQTIGCIRLRPPHI